MVQHISVDDIREIITDKKDAEKLHEHLIKFYNRVQQKRKEYKNKNGGQDFPYEVGCGRTISGQNYENFDNKSKGELELPLELEYAGCTEGLFYNMHYHPNAEVDGEKLKFTCFQSSEDILNLLMLNTKYNITMGNDGFMIIENSNYNNEKNHLNPNDYTGSLKEKTDKMTHDREEIGRKNKIFKDYVNLYNKMNEDYDDVFDEYDVNDKLSKFSEGSHEYDLLDNGYFSHYISDNIQKYTDDFNKKLKGIKITHIPKKQGEVN